MSNLNFWEFFTDLAIVLGIIASLITIYLLIKEFIDRFKIRKKYYEIVCEKSSKLKPTDILGFRGYEKHGFNKYYKDRHHDHAIENAIKNGEDILITGNPLAGKTRAVYHALKNLEEPVDVIVPRVVDIDTAEFKIPKKIFFKRRGVLILDDIDKFAEKQGFFHLLSEFHNKGYTIIATCRLGNPYDTFKSKAERENYPPFKNEVEIPRISKKDGEKVSKKVKTKLPRTFDGNIGSIFLSLETMIERFKKSTKEEKGILRSIFRLYVTGIYEGREQFEISRVRKVCEENEGIRKENYEWTDLFEKLKTNGFFEIYQNVIEVEEAYLHIYSVGGIYIKDFYDMFRIFKKDPNALYSFGRRAYEIGELVLDKAKFMKLAIKANSETLKIWTKRSNPVKFVWASNSLGIAYGRLSEVEDIKENIKRAIHYFNKSLKVRNLNKSPLDYAMTQMNIGVAYRKLSEVEDKAQNAKKAIVAFEEALRFYTSDRFQMQYIATQINMGGAYVRLSEVEGKSENTKNAIKIYEEALNVYTPDLYPMQHGMIQMNLGNAYRTLSEVEEKTENAKKAILAYEEALKVRTLDRFPMDYATTKMNLGSAYIRLSESEDRAKNAMLAINDLEKALKVFKLDRFPMQYADTQTNLGAAYGMLAGTEEPYENTMKELRSYEEALEVYTEDKFPIQFQTIMHNAGIGMARLKRLEEEEKVKK